MSETIWLANVFWRVGILVDGNCQRVVQGGMRASSEFATLLVARSVAAPKVRATFAVLEKRSFIHK